MQEDIAVYLKSRKLVCHEGNIFIILLYTVHLVCKGSDM